MSYARDEIHSLSLLRFVQVFDFLLEIGKLLLKIGDVLLEVANLLGVVFVVFLGVQCPVCSRTKNSVEVEPAMEGIYSV